MVAYGQISFANHELQKLSRLHPTEIALRDERSRVRREFEIADYTLLEALDDLRKFLAKE